MNKFCLPDLGEGLQGAEIIEWKIKPGDKVLVDQLVLVVETAKAIVEIPSPVAALVECLNCAPGDMVEVGAVLMEYSLNSPSNEDKSKSQVKGASEAEIQQAAIEQKSVSVVGKLQSVGDNAKHYDDIIVDQALKPNIESREKVTPCTHTLNAPPSVRVFAEKLGLEAVLDEKQYGTYREKDLLELYKKEHDGGKSAPQASGDSILKLSGARKVMAQTMSKSHEHIPSVTLFDDANISHWRRDEDITLRCIKAMIAACQTEPILNAWFDEEALSIQLFEDIHLGVAVNSKQGLFVPVIRKVQNLDEGRIRDILQKQIQTVQDRSIKPQKLLGATISLSNFGSLSGRYATPIIVPPQVAIIGVGKIREEPVVEAGRLEVGRVMPLSLSFDHRAASGAEAARFMQALIVSLES